MPTTYTPGQYISWDGRYGTDTVRITAVDRNHITWESWDGQQELLEFDSYRPLAQATQGWRPATPDEIATYQQYRRPAPENWH